VLSTIRQVASRLTIDGFVYRFDPQQTPGLNGMPMGEFEAAFLPCTFWLATAYSMSDSPDAAERILKKAESYTGANRLFAEAADPRAQIFMGNFPLLFSQVEYARALAELDKARSRATQQNRHNPVFKAA
jgi:GH15 family glucan-1,4-alpha-glucosidase